MIRCGSRRTAVRTKITVYDIITPQMPSIMVASTEKAHDNKNNKKTVEQGKNSVRPHSHCKPNRADPN
jgi:hypothetical protein